MSKDCYGKQRTRRRAKRLLTAQKTRLPERGLADTWLVCGGEAEHIVIVGDNGTYFCGCGKHKGAQDKMCSHCLAVWLAIHGNFRKDKQSQERPPGAQ